MDRVRRLWPALFLALLPLIVLLPAFQNGTVGAFDQIRQMAPWYGPRPSQPWDVLQADSVLQFYPWRDLVLSAWGHGQLPLWNPYQLAGTPLLANSQSAGFYPLHILLGLLHVPTPIAIDLLAWFHLCWAGLGTYLLVRRLGGGQVGATVAGASFSCSAFMLGWAPLASVVTTVSWIPWVIACIVAAFTDDPVRRMLEEEDPSRFQHADDSRTFAAEYVVRQSARQRRGSLVSLALVASSGMMVLAGHLQFVAYGFMAAVVVAISLAAAAPRPDRSIDVDGEAIVGARPGIVDAFRPLFRVGVCMVLGVLLAAPQLLPVLSYSQFSHRRNSPDEKGYGDYVASSLTPKDVVARLSNPFGQGDPTEAIAPGQPSTFWPAIAKPGANFAESASTVGPVILLLLCLLPLLKVDWRKAGGIAAVAIFAALLAVGSPLNKLLYFVVPGWSSTGMPARVLVLFVLAACALGGLALDSKLLSVPRKQLGYALGAFAVLFALTLLPTSAVAPTGIAPDTWGAVVAAGNSTGLAGCLLVALVAVGGIVLWTFGKADSAKYAPLAGPVVATLFVMHVVRTGDPSFLTPSNPVTQERIAALNQPWGLTGAASAILPPNTATAMRIHDLAGYDSLLHRDTVAMLRDVDGRDPAPDANGNIMFVKPTADPAKLSASGVGTVWARQPWGPTPPTRSVEGRLEYALGSPGRVSIARGTATIVEDGLDRLRIELAGDGHLVLRDRNLPGWSATIDGKPIVISGTTWRELDVPVGSKLLEMRYSPPGLRPGLWLFLIGFVATLPLLLSLRRSAKQV